MNKPLRIFLLGFMGSGKTHWAKIWAQKYNLAGYDLDDIIEQKENLSINEIFNQKGEPYFREEEAKALRTFAFEKNFILACGGGTPCYLHNLDWMKVHGITIYLKTSPATIAERLIKHPGNRPLLQALDPVQIMDYAAEKIKERETYYLESTLVLTEDKINSESLSMAGL